MPIPNDTLEIDAQGREGFVLDIALPVLSGWSTSVRVSGFRPSMGVSGLSAREVARLRTLGLATSARATGIFEGANDFRFAFPTDPERAAILERPGVEADLAGHPLPPVVSDLSIAAFGLPEDVARTHSLEGLTHTRGADSHGFGVRTFRRLAAEFDLDLGVVVEAVGFEPQGLGRLTIGATTGLRSGRPVNWKDRGNLRAIHITLGGVRPKLEAFDRIEESLREVLWEARRIEPVFQRLITPGVDQGTFLQVDVETERGGATFVEMLNRSTAPLPLARRAGKRVFGYLDTGATTDEITGPLVLAAAIAARGDFQLALVPSQRLTSACALLRDLGAYIEEEEAPGLLVLRTRPR